MQATASWITGKQNCLDDLISTCQATLQQRGLERSSHKRTIATPKKSDEGKMTDETTPPTPHSNRKPPKKAKQENVTLLGQQGGQQRFKI